MNLESHRLNLERARVTRAALVLQREWRLYLARTEGQEKAFRYLGGVLLRRKKELFPTGFWK